MNISINERLVFPSFTQTSDRPSKQASHTENDFSHLRQDRFSTILLPNCFVISPLIRHWITKNKLNKFCFLFRLLLMSVSCLAIASSKGKRIVCNYIFFSAAKKHTRKSSWTNFIVLVFNFNCSSKVKFVLCSSFHTQNKWNTIKKWDLSAPKNYHLSANFHKHTLNSITFIQWAF